MSNWYQNSFFKTQFVTVFNILTVSGETFVAESMELALSEPLDPATKKLVEKFVREEHSHSHATHGFNKKFCGDDWRAHLFHRICSSFISLCEPLVSTNIKLSMVAASEFWTANAASIVLDHQLIQNMNEPAAKQLFEWHCKEEIAHSRLPLLVMDEMKINPLERFIGFLLSSLTEFWMIALGCILLVLTSPQIFNPKTWYDGFTFFFTDEKILFRTMTTMSKHFERQLLWGKT